MPAPTNISAGTATEIVTLPFSTTQVVDFAGVTYTVWYKYTFPTTSVIGVWGYGGVTYTPTLDVYGPNSSIIHSDLSSALNRPVQLSGEAGDEFFFKFTTNGGNPSPANLELSFIAGSVDAVPLGSLMINDDTPGFPGVIISATDGAVLKFVTPFPSGEQGDSILTPVVVYVVEDFNTGEIAVFDEDFVEITRFSPLGTDGQQPLVRANKTLDKIYVLSADSNDDWILQSVTPAGVVSGLLTTIDISQSSTFVRAFCVANDGNIVYITSGSPSIIKRWNIALAAFGTDLVTSIGANYSIGDILVLEDDSVVVLYHHNGTGSIIVKVYDIAGATLQTFDYGTGNKTTGFHHLAYALDSPDSFWLWTHPSGSSGTSRFRNVETSTGTDLEDFTIIEYETGVYNAAATPTPLARFGISFSCPFFMVGTSEAGGTITVNKIVVDGTPGQEFDFTASGGLTPSTFTLEDGGSQSFTDLVPGTYGIAETPDAGFTTIYLVSNGDPINAIEIVGDEIVTITVTNTALPPFNPLSGIYKVVPGKRNDTLWESFDPEETEDVKIPDPFIKSALFGK